MDVSGDWDAAERAQESPDLPQMVRKSRKLRSSRNLREIGREDSDIEWGSDGPPNHETDEFVPLDAQHKPVSAQDDIIADWMENAMVDNVIDSERPHVTLEDIAIQEAHEIEDEWMSGEDRGNSEDDDEDEDNEEDQDAYKDGHHETNLGKVAEGDDYELSEGFDEFDDLVEDPVRRPGTEVVTEDDDNDDGFDVEVDVDDIADADVDDDLDVDFGLDDMDNDSDSDFDQHVWAGGEDATFNDDEDELYEEVDGPDVYSMFGFATRTRPDDFDELELDFSDLSEGPLGLDPWDAQPKRAKSRPDFSGSLWADKLSQQWEKDRKTKAQKKAARQEARQQRNLQHELFPNSHGKLTKSKLKKMQRSEKLAKRADLRAVAADSARERPDAALEVNTLADVKGAIDRFLSMQSHTTLSLPAMHKGGRALVHNLANAYSLKSKSRGGGKSRFTVLYKTKHSGKNVDYKRANGLARIPIGLRGTSEGRAPREPREPRQEPLPRNRNGVVVGGGARVIGSENIGHRLLASMGWNEGQGLGAGGMAEPIAATVKVTRGGLGF